MSAAEAWFDIGEGYFGGAEGDVQEAFTFLLRLGDKAVVDIAHRDFISGENFQRVVFIEL